MKFDYFAALAQAALSYDIEMVKTRINQAMANEEAAKRYANREVLKNLLYRYGSAKEKEEETLENGYSAKTFADLVLPQKIIDVAEFVKAERGKYEELEQHDFLPRNKILCTGQPGTGKTSFAAALANFLELPFYIASWPNIINSYLGESSKSLKKMLDYAANRNCVLLLDEVDIILKERGGREDKGEVGEMKRIVCDFLPRMENIHWNCVIVAATNHPQLLDVAAWRRFDFILDFPDPDKAMLKQMADKFCKKHNLPEIKQEIAGDNFALVERQLEDAARRHILFGKDFLEEFTRNNKK